MCEIKTYQNLNFGEIRTTSNKDGIPLFCLKDICDILEIGKPSNVKTRLSDPYVDSINVGVQTGIKRDGTPALQNVPMTFVSEAGLYQAVFMSRKPNAQLFTQWVTNEVLPMIRKTGAYFTDETWERITQNPGDLGRLLIDYQNRLDNLEAENKALKPSAQKWDNWLSSKNIYTVHQATYILGIKGMGLKNLFKYFRENGFVSSQNIAFRQFEDQGLFRVKEIDTITKNGYRYHRFQTFLTPKGIDYFKTRLINEGYKDLDFYGEPEGMISDYVPTTSRYYQGMGINLC